MKTRHKIYFKLMGGFLASVCLLSACTALDRHSAIVRLAVSQATMRYIEQSPVAERVTKASRILSVIEVVKTRVEGDKPVTVAELADFALTFIPQSLEPSDRALALGIVQIAAQELSNQVGQEVLPADARVKVADLLLSISSAASYFLAH